MKREHDLFINLLFLVVVLLMQVGEGQNTATDVKVGIVDDVGMAYSNMTLFCINMSLSDFYSSHPETRTRLVTTIVDSKKDVVIAAAAGTRISSDVQFLSAFILSLPSFFFRITKHSLALIAFLAALDLITNQNVKAIIGPWTSMQAQFMIEIGQKSQVPIVSYSATSPFLASIRSQYFFRATYDDSSQVHAIKAIIKLFGWREVVPVYVDNTFGEGIMPHLTDALQEINVRIPYRTVISPNATDDEISLELLRMMTLPTRVFVVHIVELLASRFFAKAKEIGLMKQGYVWILTNAITDGLSLMNETELDTMQGVLGVKTYVPRSEELEAFKSRWKNRFPLSDLSVYGLWAYDATTALALAIEEAGTSNFTFVKTDAMRKMSGFQGLGVSQYGPKLLQTLSGVRFKGLAGDFRFINRELQPSVFEIVNVNGHGGRTIGYWMKEHGLLKNVDQTQATMTTFSTWKDLLRPVIWPGDTTFVPKGWEIPTNGKRLKIGVPTNSGSPQFVKVTRDPITNSTTFSGFCIEYFEAVIQAMPYDVSYDFYPIEDMDYETLVYQVYLGVKHYQQFSSCMSFLTSTKLDSLNDSLVLLCLEQKYDAVVGDTTISANRSKYVEFSLPYTPSGVGLVVPVKDNVKRSSTIFLMPLTWGLWLLSLLSFFIIAIVVWVLEHRVNPEFDGPGNYQISTILWFSFSIMVFAPSMSTLSFTLLCQFSFFTYLILVLTQSYTASLASLLTSQQLHPTVTNINSLLEKGEVVGYQSSSFVLERLRESGFSDAKLVNYHGAEHCDELLSIGSARGGISAALMEVPYVRVFLGQYCNKYKMVQTPFKVDGLGFVFPIGSPLVADVSRAILKVEESNKANQLENAWFKKIDESCSDPLTGPDPNPSVSFRKLGIDSFWVLFLTAAVVCAFALGKCMFHFLKENPDQRNLQGLWEKFLQPDRNSYINQVTKKCQCSMNNHAEANPANNGSQS
ncbi:glutamate receptor 2.1-like [Brassica rapa]|uniref:glutamate receptor 2.1-like n=1 Tax=Brassica campestris TaxID=3711 RepID=UPI00142D555C|nr:glutamate receptor 2.1-like [Brassica rapa]